jgi:hypothetical protein
VKTKKIRIRVGNLKRPQGEADPAELILDLHNTKEAAGARGE